jgi:hypothetical protein
MTFKFFIAVILCFFSSNLYSALDLSKYDPIDHHGEDLIIEENTTLYGYRVNINNFHIATSTTLTVFPYDPLVTYSGRLVIHTNAIDIKGTIDASGAGYTGGGAGQGGGMESVAGVGRYEGYEGTTGGFGMIGDGRFAGDGNGGYNTPGYNTDQSTDEMLYMGSGGMGGNGGASGRFRNTAGAGGGGGGGGCGGGFVKLYSFYSCRISGNVDTSGTLGQNGGDGDASNGSCYPFPYLPEVIIYNSGIGGTGGNAWPSGEGLGGKGDDNIECDSYAYDGEAGGSGAGGGILIKCENPGGIEITGEINSLGGGRINPEENGGTLKIFSPSSVFLGQADIKVGRLYIDAPPLKLVGWFLY